MDPVSADENNGALFNRYMYAANDPYSYFDPDGRCTGSRITNSDDTCKSTGDFTTQGFGPTMRGAQTVVHQAAIDSQMGFNPATSIAFENSESEPAIPLAGSMGEFIENTYERIIRRTSLTASGGAAAGIGVDGIATKTTRSWQHDRAGAYGVIGLGGYVGANANFRLFSWGDKAGTTGMQMKGNPLGYFRLRVGAGLSIGVIGRVNDHGGGSLSVSFGGGIGAQAIVKPPAMLGLEKEL